MKTQVFVSQFTIHNSTHPFILTQTPRFSNTSRYSSPVILTAISAFIGSLIRNWSERSRSGWSRAIGAVSFASEQSAKSDWNPMQSWLPMTCIDWGTMVSSISRSFLYLGFMLELISYTATAFLMATQSRRVWRLLELVELLLQSEMLDRDQKNKLPLKLRSRSNWSNKQ